MRGVHMTVTSAVARNDYVGTGTLADYAFTFPILDVDSFLVSTITSGAILALSRGADYTVALDPITRTGTIHLVAGNLASGALLSLVDNQALTQLTQYDNSNKYPPATVERSFDHVSMQLRTLQEEIRHTIRFPQAENIGGLLAGATARASKYLGFDPSGLLTLATPPSRGGGGGGSGIGTSVTQAPFNATGLGLSDDTAAIQACIAACPDLGVVWLPIGTYLITSDITLPRGISIVGESMFGSILLSGSAVTTVQITGDKSTLSNFSLVSGATYRMQVKTNNVNYPTVKNCFFNRSNLILSNDTAGDFYGGTVECNIFTGDYSAFPNVNIVNIRAIKRTRFVNNTMVNVSGQFRMCKFQASTFYVLGLVGNAFQDGFVCTGNIFHGTMSSTKQVIDCFDGVARSVISNNIFDVTGTGAGFSCFIEQKTGNTGASGLWHSKMSEFLICDNIMYGNPAVNCIFISGGYSLAWEELPQTSSIERNQIRTTDPNGTCTPMIEARGVHRVRICDNSLTVTLTTPPLVHRAFSCISCKSVNISGNDSSEGGIYIGGGGFTTGGDPYTGNTVEMLVSGNKIEQYRSDHGAVELNLLAGTGLAELVCVGNILKTDTASLVQAIVYIANTSMKSTVVCNNVGSTGLSSRDRLLLTGTATSAITHQYFNTWQNKTVVEFDSVINRVTIGTAAASITEFLEMSTAVQHQRYYRFGGFTRLIWHTSETSHYVASYDAAGALIDIPLNINLNVGGPITCGRPFDVLGRVRPLADNVYDIGSSSLRFRSLYLQGGQTCAVSAIKTVNFSPTDDEYLVQVDCTSGNKIVTLPVGSAGRHGRTWKLRRVDGSVNTLTVNAGGSDNILAGSSVVTTYTIAAGATSIISWDNANTRWVRE